MKRLSFAGCTSLLLTVAGCGSNSQYPQGAEKGPCYADLTCNAGLTCLSGTCVKAAPILSSGTGGSVGIGTGGSVGQPDGPVSAAWDASHLDAVDAPLSGTGGSAGTGGAGTGGRMGAVDASLDTASAPPSGGVAFAAGRAQGAMTGLGWVSLGSRSVLSSPTCGGAPIVGLMSSHAGSGVSSCAPSATTWASDGALCVSGSIPALPAAPVVDDYDNNWGIQVGVNTSEPPADQGGSTLGVSYTYVTLNVTGSPLSGLRALVHRRGDPDDATYCATFRPGTRVALAAFNTKCWGDSTTVMLTDADIPMIDRIGVQVASGAAAISVSNLCLTSISFEGNSAEGTGGARGSVGATGTGGKLGTGGVVGTGGTSSTGGTTQPPGSVVCTDTSTTSLVIDQQYGNGIIAVDNNPDKTYNVQANWWNKFNSETVTIGGLGFTLGNPSNAVSSDNNPLGFPSMFIGSYQGKTSKGSNLPKQVSALTSVPTIFRINTGIDTSNLNASYDVWLTPSSGLITGSSPGSGGAYLMVWLFMPTNRQPRGTIVMDGHSVDGVPGSWRVWYDASNPPCVSYVSASPISELSFDLNRLLQDALANKWGITASQYLSLIFAGMEVWGGGDGFQIKQFCANVL